MTSGHSRSSTACTVVLPDTAPGLGVVRRGAWLGVGSAWGSWASNGGFHTITTSAQLLVGVQALSCLSACITREPQHGIYAVQAR